MNVPWAKRSTNKNNEQPLNIYFLQIYYTPHHHHYFVVGKTEQNSSLEKSPREAETPKSEMVNTLLQQKQIKIAINLNLRNYFHFILNPPIRKFSVFAKTRRIKYTFSLQKG